MHFDGSLVWGSRDASPLRGFHRCASSRTEIASVVTGVTCPQPAFSCSTRRRMAPPPKSMSGQRIGGSQNPGRKSPKVNQDCTICISRRSPESDSIEPKQRKNPYRPAGLRVRKACRPSATGTKPWEPPASCWIPAAELNRRKRSPISEPSSGSRLARPKHRRRDMPKCRQWLRSPYTTGRCPMTGGWHARRRTPRTVRLSEAAEEAIGHRSSKELGTKRELAAVFPSESGNREPDRCRLTAVSDRILGADGC